MQNSSIVGNKIKLLRQTSGLTQRQFASELSIHMGRKKAYGVPAVSAWETGREMPPADTIAGIAEFFNISMADLIGSSTSVLPGSSPVSADEIKANLPLNKILRTQLPEFHGMPVYVVFKSHIKKDQWGLVDYEKEIIKFLDDTYISIASDFASDVDFYAIQPFGGLERARRYDRPLTTDQLKKKSRVWVEMLTYDDYVRGRYNGWWYTNREKTCLVTSRGDVLPFEGNGYSFKAYPYEI